MNSIHKSTLCVGSKVALPSSSAKRWRENVFRKGLEKPKKLSVEDNKTQSHKLVSPASKGMVGCQPHRKSSSRTRAFLLAAAALDSACTKAARWTLGRCGGWEGRKGLGVQAYGLLVIRNEVDI